MAFCSACGAEMGTGVAFCPKCGKSGSGEAATPAGTTAAAGTGMQENVAGLLCYVLGWVTGLVFFLIDKRPFVRFHAMQSIITFGGLNVLTWVLVWGSWYGGMAGGLMGLGVGLAVAGLLSTLLWIATLILWILCMVKAHQGQRFKLPIVGNLAEGYSK